MNNITRNYINRHNGVAVSNKTLAAMIRNGEKHKSTERWSDFKARMAARWAGKEA